MSQVTSPMGEVTKFERGTNGRINKVTYPDNGTRTITYGADQRPQTITLPQGTVVTLHHDASRSRDSSRRPNTGEFRDLTYGPGDRIETMTDNTGTTTYSLRLGREVRGDYVPERRQRGIPFGNGARQDNRREGQDERNCEQRIPSHSLRLRCQRELGSRLWTRTAG